MCANSEGSGETAQMHRLTWAFPGCLCDKYHNLINWFKCSFRSGLIWVYTFYSDLSVQKLSIWHYGKKDQLTWTIFPSFVTSKCSPGIGLPALKNIVFLNMDEQSNQSTNTFISCLLIFSLYSTKIWITEKISNSKLSLFPIVLTNIGDLLQCKTYLLASS